MLPSPSPHIFSFSLFKLKVFLHYAFAFSKMWNIFITKSIAICLSIKCFYNCNSCHVHHKYHFLFNNTTDALWNCRIRSTSHVIIHVKKKNARQCHEVGLNKWQPNRLKNKTKELEHRVSVERKMCNRIKKVAKASILPSINCHTLLCQ